MRYLTCIILLLCISKAFSQPKAVSSAEVRHQLKKLLNTGSVLYLAAHPDDENTGLIAYLANETLARTGYLSLTRGDGGQNLIGTEQGEALGILRTQELLQARKTDRGEQFFTRAYDFGYSKSAGESLEIWGHDEVLADVVWVIRNFRPDVIITRFPEEGYQGHGHHLASATLAREAFKAAGDPQQFPEQLNHVSVWQPTRLMFNASTWWNPNLEEYYAESGKSYIKVDINEFNPLLGTTYNAIEAESRSMHKSQGFGTSPHLGPQEEFLEHIAGTPAASNVLDDINTTWTRYEKGKKVQRLLERALKNLDPENPSASIPLLTEVYSELKKLPQDVLVQKKMEELSRLIAYAGGLYTHAYADKFFVSPGEELEVETMLINGSGFPFTISKRSLHPEGESNNEVIITRKGVVYSDTLSVAVPHDASLSQPYWLKSPRSQGLYQVDDIQKKGAPESPDPFTVQYMINAEGVEIPLTLPVLYEWEDPVAGQQLRQVEITPEVTVNLSEPSYIFGDNESKTVNVIARSLTGENAGEVSLQAPEGWQVSPRSVTVSFETAMEEKNISFNVTPPKGSSSGELNAVYSDGSVTTEKGIVSIDYPHISPQVYFPDASSKLVKLDINMVPKKIGYLMGAGDKVADALTNIGYDVTQLQLNDLDSNRLRRFDVIITGVRAYNTVQELAYLNRHLLAFVKQGGTLLIQYNTNRGLCLEDMGCYPLRLSRNRVTLENSPVKIINPSHPVVNQPNKITMEDFEGWVQERGLYFADQWAPEYETILAFKDPGEEFQEGSLLVSDFGKGKFIYTGISFFRQLPAGVPGAYKLFINLISY